MEAPVLAQREKLAGHIITQLARRRMEGSFAPTAEAAKAIVLGLVPGTATVIRCGTQTVTNLGLWNELAARPGVTLLDPYKPGLTKAEAQDIRRKGFFADVMISSTNAITVDGRLVNLDGTGNRVAPMLFGPDKVVIVAGMNKVAADLESAYARVRTYAAPANNQRLAAALGLKNPCVEDGRCHQCMSETKICNMWTVIEGQSVPGRIHVVLVAEDLGY
jgi:hypothetical protein